MFYGIIFQISSIISEYNYLKRYLWKILRKITFTLNFTHLSILVSKNLQNPNITSPLSPWSKKWPGHPQPPAPPVSLSLCAWENGDRSHLVPLQTRKSEVLPRRLPEGKVLACANPRVERFNKEEKWRSGSDLKHRDKSLSNNRWPGSSDAVVTKILQGLSTKLENEASSYLAVSLLLWK